MKPIQLAILIDDQEIDQRLYQRVLARSGLVGETLTFSFADDALEHLLKYPELDVDVIFLDINMPRMDGFQFLDAAAETLGPDFAKFVIVMLTTSVLPADRDRALAHDVVKEFISKPLTVEHVEHVAALLTDQ